MVKLIIRNIIFYRKKFLLTASLAGIIFFAAAGSFIFTTYIKELAGKPLASLQTELIMQKDAADKNPAAIKTHGVILPFSLDSFPKDQVENKISVLPDVKAVSVALVLWQFNIENNRTIVALDVNDPKVGLRDTESFLLPGGKFFGSNSSQEVLLERHFAKLYGYGIGQNYSLNGQEFKIIGLVDFGQQSGLADAQIFLPYETALKIIGAKSEIANQAFISLRSAAALQSVENDLSKQFPGYSLANQDSLVKNLTGLNRMFYKFGSYFELAMLAVCVFLLLIIMRLRRMEYEYQPQIFRFLGWPPAKISLWNITDSFIFLVAAASLGAVLAGLLWWLMPAIIHISPLINYSMAM